MLNKVNVVYYSGINPGTSTCIWPFHTISSVPYSPPPILTSRLAALFRPPPPPPNPPPTHHIRNSLTVKSRRRGALGIKPLASSAWISVVSHPGHPSLRHPVLLTTCIIQYTVYSKYTVDDGSFSSGMHMQMHMPEQHEKQKLPKSRPSEEFSIKLYPSPPSGGVMMGKTRATFTSYV